MLAVLGHRKHLQVIWSLSIAGGSLVVADLQAACGFPADRLNQYLRALEDAEFVSRIRDGRTVTCSLNTNLANAIGSALLKIAQTAQMIAETDPQRQPGTTPMTNAEGMRMVRALKALGHLKRLRIVIELAMAGGTTGYTNLRTKLGLRSVTLNQQFMKLRKGEIAHSVKQGRTTTGHLNVQLVHDVGVYLQNVARTARAKKTGTDRP